MTPQKPMHVLSDLAKLSAPSSPLSILFMLLVNDDSARLNIPTLVGLLSWMDQNAFAPDLRIEVSPSGHKTMSLLEAALTLAQRDPPKASNVPWPMSLEKMRLPLAGHGGGWYSLNAEWLAATLLAAGANPWSDVNSKHPLGKVLPRALSMRMTGLVARIWAYEEGRPTLRALSKHRPDGAEEGMRGWLDWASAQEDGADLVRWLLSVGVRSPEGVHSVSWARTAAMIAVYEKAGALPTTSEEKAQVTSASEHRLAAIDPASKMMLQSFKEVFAPPPTTDDLAAKDHQAILDTLALSSWGHLGTTIPRPPRLTIDQLNARTNVESGLHKGCWSHLAAVLALPIRPPWSHSIGCNDFSKILEVPDKIHNNYGGRHEINWAAHRGALTPAIDFDWRPGISINGVVGLGLHGYKPESDEGQREELCGLLGIEDFTPWWRANAAAAAGFTKALSLSSSSASDRLHHIWQMLRKQDPDTFKDSPQGALTMLQVFNRHFFLSGSGLNQLDGVPVQTSSVQGKSFAYDGYALVGWLLKFAPVTLDVDWQVELALLGNVHTPRHLDNLIELSGQGHLEKHHIERIKEFMDVTLKRVSAMLKKDDNSSGQTHTYVRKRGELFEHAVLPKLRPILTAAKLTAKLPKASNSSTSGRSSL